MKIYLFHEIETIFLTFSEVQKNDFINYITFHKMDIRLSHRVIFI